jgi:DNA-binding MarR family transcriptional regulator
VATVRVMTDPDDLVRERLPLTIDRETYTPAYLSIVSNALSRGGSLLYMHRFGIGVNDWRVLSALGNHPGATAAEVCAVLGMDKSVASRSVAGLVDRRLVAIERVPGQRRLYLTRAGADVHDQLLPVALERERRLLQGFSAAEVAVLREFLRRMNDNVPAINAPGDDEPDED